MNGLTWEDPATIGFVIASYQDCALDNAELGQWAESMIATVDDYPTYLLDLMDYHGTRAKVHEAVGFRPPSGLSGRQHHALTGIAYLRGFGPFDDIGRDKALAILEACPDIRDRFCRTFPFIALPEAP